MPIDAKELRKRLARSDNPEWYLTVLGTALESGDEVGALAAADRYVAEHPYPPATDEEQAWAMVGPAPSPEDQAWRQILAGKK